MILATEAEEPSLLAGKKASKASGKSAERVRTTERLNLDATTIVRTILSPSHVAETTASGDEHEAPAGERYVDTDSDRVYMRALQVEQVDLVQRQKQASKELKEANRKIRGARRGQTSLAQTQDMGTPQAAGSRSTVQTTCVVGLMPGADGQAAAETVLSNPKGSGKEIHCLRRRNEGAYRKRVASGSFLRRSTLRNRRRAGVRRN